MVRDAGHVLREVMEREPLERGVGREDRGGEDGTFDAGRRDDGEGFRQGTFADAGDVLDGQYAFHDAAPFYLMLQTVYRQCVPLKSANFEKKKKDRKALVFPFSLTLNVKCIPFFCASHCKVLRETLIYIHILLRGDKIE